MLTAITNWVNGSGKPVYLDNYNDEYLVVYGQLDLIQNKLYGLGGKGVPKGPLGDDPKFKQGLDWTRWLIPIEKLDSITELIDNTPGVVWKNKGSLKPAEIVTFEKTGLGGPKMSKQVITDIADAWLQFGDAVPDRPFVDALKPKYRDAREEKKWRNPDQYETPMSTPILTPPQIGKQVPLFLENYDPKHLILYGSTNTLKNEIEKIGGYPAPIVAGVKNVSNWSRWLIPIDQETKLVEMIQKKGLTVKVDKGIDYLAQAKKQFGVQKAEPSEPAQAEPKDEEVYKSASSKLKFPTNWKDARKGPKWGSPVEPLVFETPEDDTEIKPKEPSPKDKDEYATPRGKQWQDARKGPKWRPAQAVPPPDFESPETPETPYVSPEKYHDAPEKKWRNPEPQMFTPEPSPMAKRATKVIKPAVSKPFEKQVPAVQEKVVPAIRSPDNFAKLVRSINENDVVAVAEIVKRNRQVVNHVNDSNQTALFLALDRPQIIEILLKNGANPNHIDAEGYTPLIMATFTLVKNVPETLKSIGLLAAAGADPNYRDPSGYSAVDYYNIAKRRGVIPVEESKKIDFDRVLRRIEEIVPKTDIDKALSDLERELGAVVPLRGTKPQDAVVAPKRPGPGPAAAKSGATAAAGPAGVKPGPGLNKVFEFYLDTSKDSEIQVIIETEWDSMPEESRKKYKTIGNYTLVREGDRYLLDQVRQKLWDTWKKKTISEKKKWAQREADSKKTRTIVEAVAWAQQVEPVRPQVKPGMLAKLGLVADPNRTKRPGEGGKRKLKALNKPKAKPPAAVSILPPAKPVRAATGPAGCESQVEEIDLLYEPTITAEKELIEDIILDDDAVDEDDDLEETDYGEDEQDEIIDTEPEYEEEITVD